MKKFLKNFLKNFFNFSKKKKDLGDSEASFIRIEWEIIIQSLEAKQWI